MLRRSETAAIVECAGWWSHFGAEEPADRELYGNTSQLYKPSVHPSLDKVLEVQPAKLELVMDEMKQILTSRPQIKHSMVHKVFLEFFF